MPFGNWVTFEPNQRGYKTLAKSGSHPWVVMSQDDGIERILFGIGRTNVTQLRSRPRKTVSQRHFVHWLQKILFLDALNWVSKGRVAQLPLTRYLMVDIDDVFVGKNRLTVSDVDHMMESQKRIRQMVPGFRYNIGFSGNSFKTGTPAENEADEYLIANRDQFSWFPHEWQHMQPHLFDNVTVLINRMTKNK